MRLAAKVHIDVIIGRRNPIDLLDTKKKIRPRDFTTSLLRMPKAHFNRTDVVEGAFLLPSLAKNRDAGRTSDGLHRSLNHRAKIASRQHRPGTICADQKVPLKDSVRERVDCEESTSAHNRQ